MPLFEYRCQACDHLEEVLQKHTDPAPEACPACGKPGTMAKAISLTSFQLKGGGWYKDLYASSPTTSTKAEGGDQGKAAAPSTSSAPSSGGASSATASKPSESKPSESKPAATKTTASSSAPAASA